MKKILCFSLFLLVVTATLLGITATAQAKETPEIAGVSGVVLVNTETGTEIFKYNSDVEMTPSGTSRLMALLVCYERLKPTVGESVVITADMVKGYENYNSFYTNKWRSLSNYVGQYVKIEDLFKLAVVYSSDDACNALAVVAFGSVDACIAAMNEKAAALGMTRTSYTGVATSTSLSGTTASDTARLAAAFYQEVALAELARSQSASVSVGSDRTTVYNRNLFNSSYYGTGYYDSTVDGILYHAASGSLISARADENLTYVCVVLGADTSGASRYSDGSVANAYTVSSSLLDYGMGSYGFLRVISPLQIFADIPVTLSKQADFVTAVPSRELLVFLPKSVDLQTDISYSTHLSVESIEAPVSLGENVGYVEVIYDGEVIGSVDLVTNASLSKSLTLDFVDFVVRVISYPLTVALLALAALACIFYVLYRAQKISEEEKED